MDSDLWTKQIDFPIYSGYAVFQLGFADEPLFKLIKTDGTTQEPLPNVKFAIKKINDDETEEDAKDTAGNIIGEEEKINGETYHVIKTDEKGEIKEDLPEGLYKVIEVETLEGYEFSENIEDRTYYFGIGKSKAAVKDLVEERNTIIQGNGILTYEDIINTNDGGYVVLAGVNGEYIINAEETESNTEITLSDNTGTARTDDGALTLIKYSSDEKIEWATTINQNTLYRMKVEQSITGDYYVLSSNTIIKFDNNRKFALQKIWRIV